jgi:hypothetical protein
MRSFCALNHIMRSFCALNRIMRSFCALNRIMISFCALNHIMRSFCALNRIMRSFCALNRITISIYALNRIWTSFCALNRLKYGTSKFWIQNSFLVKFSFCKFKFTSKIQKLNKVWRNIILVIVKPSKCKYLPIGRKYLSWHLLHVLDSSVGQKPSRTKGRGQQGNASCQISNSRHCSFTKIRLKFVFLNKYFN